MTGGPGPRTQRLVPAILRVAAVLAVVLTLTTVALCGALAVRTAAARALRSPEQVAADWEYGLWRWVGDLDPAEGLADADHNACKALRPFHRALKRETVGAARDVGGALSVALDWVQDGDPVEPSGSTVALTGTASLTLSGIPGQRIGLAWQARRTWTLTLDHGLGRGWRVCQVSRSGPW